MRYRESESEETFATLVGERKINGDPRKLLALDRMRNMGNWKRWKVEVEGNSECGVCV